MALQNGLFTLALSALLLAPVAAKADDGRWGGPHEAVPVGPRAEQFRGGYRPPPPAPARPWTPRHDGRYELQTVHQEVPGYYQQVWVAESCSPRPYRRGMSCVPAHSEQRWVPGYTQAAQEWVWVPFRHDPYWRG